MKRGILSIAAFLCLSVMAQAATVHVDIDAVGGNDGTTWADAYTNLQSALGTATGADEIWVAEGNYYPGPASSDHFTFQAGYSIYGAFDGTETNLVDRDLTTNQTVLNGDVDKNGTLDSANATVFSIELGDAATGGVLDGFTIANGYGGYGGGFRMDNSGTVIVRNCLFTNNYATSHGGALCNYTHGADSLTVESCVFYDNKGNEGAICNYGTTLTIINCTFTSNSTATGRSWYMSAGQAEVYNSILWDTNTAACSGGGIYEKVAGNTTVMYCDVNGDWSGISGGEGVITNWPMFKDVDGGDLNISDGSPCVDAGTNSPAAATDILGMTRPQADRVDIGAYEKDGTPDFDAPGPVTDVSILGEINWLWFAWTNPTNEDYLGVLVLRSEEPTPMAIPTNGVDYTTNDTINGDQVIYVGTGTNVVPGEDGGFIDGSGLLAGTNYFYSIFTYDEVPNYSTRVDTNHAAVDTIWPAPVTNLQARAEIRHIVLDWYNPPDLDFTGVLILRRIGADPTGNPVDFTPYTTNDTLSGDEIVYVGPGDNLTPGVFSGHTDGGLSPALTYHYRVFAFDDVFHYSGAETATGVPMSPSLFIFVDIDAAGTNGGTSWQNAYTNLQDGLADARVSGKDVWVAEGTYYPTYGTERSAKFELVHNVGIYGGFDGSEEQLADRDITNHVTILSGDLDKSGSLDSLDSGYGIVFGHDVFSSILDGFTVQHGYGDLGFSGQYSGGLFIVDCSAIIRNCIIRECYGVRGGGTGVYGDSFNNRVVIANCLYLDNTGGKGGALGIYHNLAAGSPTYMVNCTLYGNTSPGYGSIYLSNGGHLDARNTIFWDSGADGGGIFVKDETAGRECYGTLNYCNVNGGWPAPSIKHLGADNINVDPLFDSVPGEDFNLQETSPCKDSGDPNSPAEIQEYDANLQLRIYHQDPIMEDGRVDMGCYEWPRHRQIGPPQGTTILLYGVKEEIQ